MASSASDWIPFQVAAPRRYRLWSPISHPCPFKGLLRGRALPTAPDMYRWLVMATAITGSTVNSEQPPRHHSPPPPMSTSSILLASLPLTVLCSCCCPHHHQQRPRPSSTPLGRNLTLLIRLLRSSKAKETSAVGPGR